MHAGICSHLCILMHKLRNWAVLTLRMTFSLKCHQSRHSVNILYVHELKEHLWSEGNWLQSAGGGENDSNCALMSDTEYLTLQQRIILLDFCRAMYGRAWMYVVSLRAVSQHALCCRATVHIDTCQYVDICQQGGSRRLCVEDFALLEKQRLSRSVSVCRG